MELDLQLWDRVRNALWTAGDDGFLRMFALNDAVLHAHIFAIVYVWARLNLHVQNRNIDAKFDRYFLSLSLPSC